uniref:phage tail protein n=1 Tax=Herbidospora sakaeratensis TaxID=564415 RepID=UPI0007865CEE|nr:phage tail protein [Herbidospora sakaeratensis]
MSGYLDHLPAVLRSKDLADLLDVFEKTLSGIDDGVATPGAPLAPLIEALPDLYDPARTRPEFLPWLAGWLGFELPPGWTVAQRRRVVAGVMGLHLRRGTHQGLAELLDLAVPVAGRQRVTVDAGAKVLFARPAPGAPARVHTLLSQGPYLRPDRTLAHSGLVSPQCLATTPAGDLLVGDAGGIGRSPAPGLWRVTRTGAYADHTGAPPAPRPLGSAAWNLTTPVAVAVEATPAGWAAYVLDVQQTGLRLSRLTSAAPFQEETLALHASVQTVVDIPAAVVHQGKLLILNRKDRRVVEVDPAAPSAPPRTIALPGLTSPRSMTVAPDGRLVVGDARPDTPAELFLVDAAGATAPMPLLAAVAGNPLLAPYAVLHEDSHVLLVLDVGLQPDQDPARPYLRRTLRPALLYRVDLRTDPPRVTPASEPGGLVFPRGMVRHEGVLYLCDGGEPLSRNETGPNGTPRRNLRASANELAVIVHFARAGATEADQRVALRSVGDALDRERPASVLPTLLSAIGTD